MNLYKSLSQLRIKYAKLLPADRTAVMDGHMEYLRASGAMESILKEGDTMPEFTLEDGGGKVINSKELLLKGPLVVTFFRGLWCPYCVEEIKALNDAYDDIKAAGGELIAISPQLSTASKKQMEDAGLRFSILVDHENAIGKAFRLTYKFPDDLRGLYESVFKLDIAAKNGSTNWELPIPARFVIDQTGTVLDVKAEPDYRFRPEAQDSVSVLHSLKSKASC